MTSEWLGLSETADLLGVHPSTVRSWADKGRLPVHRTGGGHRRFRRADIELWLQSHRDTQVPGASQVIQNAVRHTRFFIMEGHLEREDWYQKIDERGRETYRQGGGALMHGLKVFLASDENVAHAEAKSIGHQYGYWGYCQGLSSVDSTRAFLSFRRLLVESMLRVYEDAEVHSSKAWGDMFRRITKFTDLVLSALLDTYEEYQQRELESIPG